MTDAPLSALAAETFRDPAAAARAVLARHWTRDVLWMALVAVSAVSTILSHLTVRATAAEPALVGPLLAQPLLAFAVEVGVIWFTAFSLWRVGRSFGGAGDAQGAMALVVWLQGLMAAFQAVLLLVLGLPLIFSFVWAAGMVLGFWWFVRFAMALHGFTSPLRVAATTALVALSLMTALALLLNMLGLGPAAPVAPA